MANISKIKIPEVNDPYNLVDSRVPDPVQVSSNTDFNDFTTPGYYCVMNSTIMNTISNKPDTNNGGQLHVELLFHEELLLQDDVLHLLLLFQ